MVCALDQSCAVKPSMLTLSWGLCANATVAADSSNAERG